jgi:fructosamine-3-kinase
MGSTRCGTEVLQGRRVFVKRAAGADAAMLECEADGLRALAATATIRVPAIVADHTAEDDARLVLEWLDLAAPTEPAALGRALAELHAAPAPRGPCGERFGWQRDNYIGGTPQINGWSDDWTTFFRDARLAPQFERAFRNGFRGKLARDGGRLLRELPDGLRDHAPSPSLVHGDLWQGNAGTLPDGTPVVFDPAVYVGDADVDVAMTELFGGFGAEFMRAYESVRPISPGYPMRRDLYNLYHLLNHLNLFGAAYLARTAHTLAKLVAR